MRRAATCSGSPIFGGLRYLDVWESEEACARAFDERVHPAVDRAFGGVRPAGEPVVTRPEVIDAAGTLLAVQPDARTPH